MKRIVGILIVTILVAMTLSGCKAYSEPANQDLQTTSEFFHFRIIETGGMGGFGDSYDIIVDDDTKVLYLYTRGGYHATTTPILNADGTPKLLSDFDTIN